MKSKLKSNNGSNYIKQFLIFLLSAICVIFITNPSVYSKSCLNAISVWAFNVLPFLLPFFIFTRLIINLSSMRPNFMDKFFSKVYHTPAPSFLVFLLSTLSGYPMGAKLICSIYDDGAITRDEASRMLSFCSVSGPMFIIGTVGVGFLHSYIAGLIILIANIIASLINGLLYRGKPITTKTPTYIPPKKDDILSNSVYDSLISILMVGAYIVLSFLIIDILKNFHIISGLSYAISSVLHVNNSQPIVEGVLTGMIEMTRGILSLGRLDCPLNIKTIISSGLIGFGGVSVMLQSASFLNKLHLPARKMLIQKFTQAIISILITIPIALLFIR